MDPSLYGGPASSIGGRLGYDPYMGGGGGMMPSTKMMLLGYNQLNTIEEEKHETQTSNYFREGDSEREDSRLNHTASNNLKGSKILNDLTNELNEYK